MTRVPIILIALVSLGARSPAEQSRCSLPAADWAAIPAGVVLFGEDDRSRPGERIAVPAFRIGIHEVTNREFATFVAASGHVTEAERQGAGAVFVAPASLGAVQGPASWWRLVRGANWRHPQGPDSSIATSDDLPVVQVTRSDAEAYARWLGARLPTEVEWERAARGGQDSTRNPRSWTHDAEGHRTANIWTGVFPVIDTAEDGYAGLAPAGCFAPNDFGLFDMVGNAWEWTSGARNGRAVVRGGSFLCASTYCANFRPAGLQAQEADLPTSHIGFRIVYSSSIGSAKRREDAVGFTSS